jgi:2-dehydropantoate 2-reductase
MTAPASPLTSSMYRDLRKGAPVEVDHILGDLLERGGAQRVVTPIAESRFRPSTGLPGRAFKALRRAAA